MGQCDWRARESASALLRAPSVLSRKEPFCEGRWRLGRAFEFSRFISEIEKRGMGPLVEREDGPRGAHDGSVQSEFVRSLNLRPIRTAPVGLLSGYLQSC